MDDNEVVPVIDNKYRESRKAELRRRLVEEEKRAKEERIRLMQQIDSGTESPRQSLKQEPMNEQYFESYEVSTEFDVIGNGDGIHDMDDSCTESFRSVPNQDEMSNSITDSLFDSDGDSADDKSQASNAVIPLSDMTASRRLAIWLSRFTWYCSPDVSRGMGNSDSDNKFDENAETDHQKLCLDKGWEYFERVTLPRHHKPHTYPETNGSANKDYLKRMASDMSRDLHHRAEPGERKPTQLYSVWGTPEEDLGDFGVGIGLYFSTLRLLSIITFIAGLILVPNMIYYASDNYQNHNAPAVADKRNFIYDTSAICNDMEWAPCPTCTEHQWDYFPLTTKRLAFANVQTAANADEPPKQQRLAFILVNYCSVNGRTGYIMWLALAFVSLAILAVNTIFRKWYIAKFDESQQTGSDYTIQVSNPPTDATSPEEWKSYFEQFGGKVVGVTVALDNQELMRALVNRRKYLYDLEIRLPMEYVRKLDIVSNPTPQKLTEAAAHAWPLAWWERLYYMDSPQTLLKNIQTLNKVIDIISAKVQKAEKGNQSSSSYYNVSSVFVTFDTEEAQRQVLEMTGGNSSSDLLFRRKHYLYVSEPKEPGDMRWLDLADSRRYKFKQLAITTIIHIITIIVGFVIVFYFRKNYGASYAALAITCLNSMVPTLCGYLVYYESHANEGSVQSSLYVKVTISLWIQTAIITAIITPFTESVSNDDTGIIHSLFAIYAFEICKGPVTQILDMYGHVNRHFWAPRAPDQKRMNLLFQGTMFSLAERYTNMTNIIFLTFCYSALFPIGFFLSSLALMIHYWTDKFCLLRSWARAPNLGPNIAKFSGYFLMGSVVFFAAYSSYNYSGFPFDNACEDKGTVVDDVYVGDYSAYDMDGLEVEISVQKNDANYFYCNQDMMRYDPFVFPAIASNQPEGKEWMSRDQEEAANLLGYTALVIVLFVSLRVFYLSIITPIMNRFCRRHESNGNIMTLKFSEVEEISAYVPQATLYGYPFPLILCDLRHVDNDYIGWTSPQHEHEFYSIVNDIPSLKDRSVFTIVKQWISAPQSPSYGSVGPSSYNK